MTQYEIKPGDSLELISHSLFGDITYFRDIADTNNIEIFDELKVGTFITIPTVKEIKRKIEAGVREVSLLTQQSLNPGYLKSLDLSGLKQAESVAAFQLVSWIIPES